MTCKIYFVGGCHDGMQKIVNEIPYINSDKEIKVINGKRIYNSKKFLTPATQEITLIFDIYKLVLRGDHHTLEQDEYNIFEYVKTEAEKNDE